MTTRFLILSDLHLEFQPFEVPPVEFDAVILAGDIHNPGSLAVSWAKQAAAFMGKPVFVVPGNHEFYGRDMKTELQLMHQACRNSNVKVLDGSLAILGTVRILGCTLWTDFELPTWTSDGQRIGLRILMEDAWLGMADYTAIRNQDEFGRGMLTPSDTRQIHFEQRAWLQKQLAMPWPGQTVVVTHHGPAIQSVSEQYLNDTLSPAFVSELPPQFFKGVDLWVHGHAHASFDYRVTEEIDSCRVVCNPRGYPSGFDRQPENEDFSPGLIIEV